jgi:uncharacterized coiled-coil protein SlyX
MRYQVEIKKDAEGFKKGETKSLTLETAKHLEKLGIGKIIGVHSKKENIKELNQLVIAQGELITELQGGIEAQANEITELQDKVTNLINDLAKPKQGRPKKEE